MPRRPWLPWRFDRSISRAYPVSWICYLTTRARGGSSRTGIRALPCRAATAKQRNSVDGEPKQPLTAPERRSRGGPSAAGGAGFSGSRLGRQGTDGGRRLMDGGLLLFAGLHLESATRGMRHATPKKVVTQGAEIRCHGNNADTVDAGGHAANKRKFPE